MDVKIFIWSINNKATVVWSCDKNLLKLCRRYKVFHGCFKSAIKIIDAWFDGALSTDDSYKINIMDSGDDPFFHYSTNARCISHCSCESTCVCYKKGDAEPVN